jgi:glycosyltransferase involved in cell wall biosynthesis
VATSGVAEGPSQALARFLVECEASAVTVVSHPLVVEGPGEHIVEELVTGFRRSIRRPNRPPVTFLFDPLTPLRLPAADAWFGFNCLVTAQGLLRRRVRQVRRVVHWSVDFVPRRFGDSPLTRVYDALDKRCILSADGRVELSDAAYRGRLHSYGLRSGQAPAEIVPMGSWTSDAPSISSEAWQKPRLVFLGHLVERMGVPLAIDLVAELRRRGRAIPLDIIGGGPAISDLRERAVAKSVEDLVTFHGFIERFSDVQRLLAGGAIALAPYDVDESSFSRFADPGKLKAYVAAGLPALLTPVPPNAEELETDGGARVLEPSVSAFADAVCELLDDRELWTARQRSAYVYGRRFDWGEMLTRSLPRLGFDVGRLPEGRLANVEGT